jgi:site-specific DNA-methyltransferase (adenine-specific)
MTREHLEACRHLLGEIPEWVEREADIRSVESKNFAEREVVGQKTAGMGSGETFGMLQAEGRNSEATKVVDITAPATPEAKQWQGWGTALKPALEPITVARKPLIGTVAENVLQHGTGAINVDGCRVGTEEIIDFKRKENSITASGWKDVNRNPYEQHSQGRWPANFIHDGSEEVTDLLGSAARFFYCAKASKRDRDEGNHHPTVKPTDLMRYLCRLVTPPDGIVLDPFMGSGSTGKAAALEGFSFIGIEREAEYVAIAQARINHVTND